MDTFQLPPLREDLSLLEGPVSPDGSPTWSLFDSARNQYYRIGWQEFEFLSRWSEQDAQTLVDRVNEETTLKVSLEQLQQFLLFLMNGNLVQYAPDKSADQLHQSLLGSRKGRLAKLLKSYLFFRVRLVHPDAFLQRTLPYVKPIISKVFVAIVLVMSVFALYLVSRQWHDFTTTFSYFFNLEGLVYFFVAMFGVKVLHELGHAYVATYYGCRVASMGVMFLVFWPVFYTDTTDAWKLTSRWQRVHIAAAGIVVELVIAVFATFLWSFLPDGPLRSATFFIATVSWFFSLVLNCNPMLRFDGYYLLSDYLNISNMQAQGFALAKWQLRRWLFGWDDPKPFVTTKGMHRFLVAWSFATWVYRFFLMLGISLLVYTLFFKLLGIIAFVSAISLFLIAPIGKELMHYWQRQSDMTWNTRTKVTVGIITSLMLLLIVPWKGSINSPGLLEYQQYSQYFVPEAAQVVQVNVQNHQRVQMGDVLMQLRSPMLAYKIQQLEYDVKILTYRLRTELGQTENYGIRQADEEDLEKKLSELNGLKEQQEKLTVRAKFSGLVTDLNQTAKPGVWLAEDQFLFELVQPGDNVITAYVPESTVKRLQKDKVARFYPDNFRLSPILDATIVSVDPVSTEVLKKPYLASTYGGDIAVNQKPQHEWVVKEAMYRVILKPTQPLDRLQSVTRGTVQLSGARRSMLASAVQVVSGVLLREASF